MAAEYFNSSDGEFDLDSNRFPTLVKRVLKAMHKDARANRIESKKTSKNLVFSNGSLYQQKAGWSWWNRFNAFTEIVLEQPAGTIPTFETIERFMDTFVKLVKLKSNHVPSYIWLKHGVENVIAFCKFEYESFEITKHASRRIDAMYNHLFREGRITKDPTVERRFVGSAIVRSLITALLSKAFDDGAMNWDLINSKCLSIVLLASLGSRAGDIALYEHRVELQMCCASCCSLHICIHPPTCE
ncbi:unnamed protein product [Periconia digitata]|uniref:Uncharacterized protein n=1 Tax=Periconia digitata TaxID=1303443 RepID=A0A9W4XYI4_9PLEO|nr:unnamed protein product [Periconia digitata]